jgi:integrase/recombinase XerD
MAFPIYQEVTILPGGTRSEKGGIMGKGDVGGMTGPLAPYAAGFREDLAGQGYVPGTASDHLRLMAQLSRWLVNQSLDVGDLTPAAVEQFLATRAGAGYVRRLSSAAVVRLLEHLRGLGVAPEQAPVVVDRPVEVLIERYKVYLFKERGLLAGSVRNYVIVARSFLSHRWDTNGGTLALEDLGTGDVTKFVLTECQRASVGSAKCMVTRLRCLLRFFFVEGLTQQELAPAVPSVASWRLASLPKAIDPSDVGLLLKSCDRQSAVGLRDYAIIVLLSRLGLRAGEVAALGLGDIDWRHGEVVIHGKARRQESLPLPVDVGEALVDWFKRGRPECAVPYAFTRVRAPFGGLSSGGVSAVVRQACGRAGLPLMGAHRLRHSAATQMLRAGGSLAEVGQVLRHRGRGTTSIYAKVDRDSLAALVQPWPGSAP